MQSRYRSPGFIFLVLFLSLSILLMLAGQTMALVDYDLAVSWGLQESRQQVGGYGVQVNRAFGAGDSFVYIPLMAISLRGLLRRKRWALLTTTATAGISCYWSVTIGFLLYFLPGTTGYENEPGLGIWIFVASYAAFGTWTLCYVLVRGEGLLETRMGKPDTDAGTPTNHPT
jgi:hypothetical protein